MPFQIGPHNRATSRLTLQQSTCWREGSGSRFPILDLKQNLTKQRSSIWGNFLSCGAPTRVHCYYKANLDRAESPSPLQHLKSHRKRMATVSPHPLPPNTFDCCYYPAGNVITAAIARAPHSHTHSRSTPLLGLRRAISVSACVVDPAWARCIRLSLPPFVRSFVRRPTWLTFNGGNITRQRGREGGREGRGVGPLAAPRRRFLAPEAATSRAVDKEGRTKR